MTKYTPICKPNQIICGTGQAVIVTGWTVKESIAKHLNPEEYAAIGNLYSATRGISFLIRNLLYNPQVKYLCILAETKEDLNSKSCQCLLNFFEHGYYIGVTDTDKKTWVISSDVKGYIDIEITQDALNTLRNTLNVAYFTSKGSLLDFVKIIKPFSVDDSKPRLTFPNSPEIKSVYLPGNIYGHRIEGKTVAETWIKLLHRIRKTGVVRPTGYDGKWQELINLIAIVTEEPEDFYFPDPNYLPLDREYLKNYIPQILDDAPYKEGVKYTYGQRLRSWFGQDQIKQVIQKLIKEIDSASAVMSLWDSGSGNETLDTVQATRRSKRAYADSDHDHSGSPCLNHIWLRVVDGKLSITALFRSNDMFAAWPSNSMGLRALQMHIRDEINKQTDFKLELAPLITISQSAHVYDDTWENVDHLIATQYQELVKKESKTFSDAVGNFIIENLFDTTIVTQTTHNGETIATYEGRNALKLVKEIAAANPSIQPDHIGYLGIELSRATVMLNVPSHHIGYQQDK
jgi:thymidylate synthase